MRLWEGDPDPMELVSLWEETQYSWGSIQGSGWLGQSWGPLPSPLSSQGSPHQQGRPRGPWVWLSHVPHPLGLTPLPVLRFLLISPSFLCHIPLLPVLHQRGAWLSLGPDAQPRGFLYKPPNSLHTQSLLCSLCWGKSPPHKEATPWKHLGSFSSVIIL